MLLIEVKITNAEIEKGVRNNGFCRSSTDLRLKLDDNGCTSNSLLKDKPKCWHVHNCRTFEISLRELYNFL